MRYLLLLLILTSSFLSCGNDERTYIYHDPVNFKVDLNNQDTELRDAGKSKCFESQRLFADRIGYGGLLVVVSPFPVDGTSIFNLYAYDMACPHEENPTIKVRPNTKGEAVCEKCGTVYNISSGLGHVQSGIGSRGLQKYGVRYENKGVFMITR